MSELRNLAVAACLRKPIPQDWRKIIAQGDALAASHARLVEATEGLLHGIVSSNHDWKLAMHEARAALADAKKAKP